MSGILYRLFGDRVKREIAANAFRPRDFSGMDFAFLDMEGREYYSWPDVGAMPPVRVKEIEGLMVMVHAGRGDAGLKDVSNAIISKANEAVTLRGKAHDDAVASIAVLAKELLFRRESIIPEEAYYALAAVCCARKDEDPAALDRTIHAQKIDTFRAAGRGGFPFFLPSASFRALLGASLCTDSAFNALLMSWIETAARRRAVLKACE